MFEVVLLSLITLGVLVMVGLVLATPYVAHPLPDAAADDAERPELLVTD